MINSAQLATFERLLDVGNLLAKRADRDMRQQCGLRNVQYEILIRLRNKGGALRMSELASALTHTPSGLTYLVGQLEDRGYVKRIPARDDERGILAHITPSGRELVRAQHDSRELFLQREVVDPISGDELAALHTVLGKMQVHLRGEMTGGIMPEEIDLVS